jgi:DNA polymerase-1
MSSGNPAVSDFIHTVLGAKQVLKRRENYTEAFLREMDSFGRVHPSINTLAARTTRMSVSNPPLQQLPTKDREEEAE